MRFPSIVRIRHIAAAVVVLVALAASASQALAQARGSVRGVVTAEDTHAPLVGARVSVETPLRVGIADQRGVYVLRDLPAGSYTVTATANGRQPVRRRIWIC